MARQRALPFGRVLGYWRAERRTIRDGSVSLVVASLGNLVAGVTLGSITGTLELLPALIILIPAAIDMRGGIFGSLGSRLGTSIHSGVFESSWRRDGILFQNLFAVTVLTVSTSLILGSLARLVTLVVGVDSISLAQFVAISMLGGLLSSIVIGAFMLGFSVRAHRRGWDLDNVSAPIVTAVGDIVTIPALFAATFVVRIPWLTTLLAGAMATVGLGVVIAGWLSRRPAARRAIHESLPVLAVAGTVGLVSGLLLETRLESFVAVPALLVLVPPFLADAGALGGILSARLASKLHLGVLTPSGRPEPVVLLDISITFLLACWLFALVGLSADIVARLAGLSSPGTVTMLGVSLLAGLMATCVSVVVAYYTAVASFRVGLDPDNHGIPIITATMDLTGIICLVVSLSIFGVV